MDIGAGRRAVVDKAFAGMVVVADSLFVHRQAAAGTAVGCTAAVVSSPVGYTAMDRAAAVDTAETIGQLEYSCWTRPVAERLRQTGCHS